MPCLAAPHGAPARGASEDTRKASEAYKEGTAAFNLGQWDKAIEAWQRGYKLKPDSVFLYNIAQAYRKAGDLDQAVFFYKNFLRNTSNAPNRDEVVGWIDQLEQDIAAQKQKMLDDQKAAEDRRVADEARAQRERDEALRRAEVPPPPKPRNLDGDIGVAVGANLWVGGLHSVAGVDPGIRPGAAVELSGGYTLVHRGRLRFRLGATVGFTYLKDVGATVNFLGFMLDPTVKIALWHDRLFFTVQVGLGAGLMTGSSATHPSYTLDSSQSAAKGSFVSFEARPAVGIEYLVVPRLSVLLTPGVVVTTPPSSHFSTELRVQILAGVQVHL
ncbi:MAG: tetratricopeptide repeat protein [Polyangia bacterium]